MAKAIPAGQGETKTPETTVETPKAPKAVVVKPKAVTELPGGTVREDY
jgi:hypothetical protein